MKKIIYTLLALSLGLASCEDSLEDTFNELDEKSEIISVFGYTITSDDYSDIVPSNGEDFYEVNSGFRSEEEALELIPAIIANNFDGGFENKVTVTSNIVNPDFDVNTIELESVDLVTANLEDSVTYELGTDDYPTMLANAFLPSEISAGVSQELLLLVNDNFQDAEEGAVATVLYDFFVEEPEIVEVSGDFENYSFQNSFEGWSAQNILGVQEWGINDDYIQASGFSGGEVPNEDWLVSPVIDLTETASPQVQVSQALNFADDISLVEILVSVDYVDDVTSATWEKIDFQNIPTGDSNDFIKSDEFDFSQYNGETVNIAFKYTSTTEDAGRWRIESLSIKDSSVAASTEYIGSKETAADFYIFQDNQWTTYDGSNNLYVLTTEDYNLIGEGIGQIDFANFDNDINAEDYLPQLLEARFPFSQEQDLKYVAYNTSNDSIEFEYLPYVFINGEWLIYDEDNLPIGDEFIESVLKFKFDNELGIFVPDAATQYTLVTEDYESIAASDLKDDPTFESQIANLNDFGNFNRNGGGTNWEDSQIEAALAVVLTSRFPDAGIDDVFEVTYSIFNGSSGTELQTLILTEEGFIFYVEE